MAGHSLILADLQRVDQFAHLGRLAQLFRDCSIQVDAQGIAWAACRVHDDSFAFTWLGAGWVFDAFAKQQRADEWANRKKGMQEAEMTKHEQEFLELRKRIRVGSLSERVAWAVHQRVVTSRSSVVRLPDGWLADYVWGAGRSRPSHWRSNLLELLKGLSWLHVARDPDGKESWGATTSLICQAADLRNDDQDECDDDCPDHEVGPHHHYLVNIGRGFLGILERFAKDDPESGVRSYNFPVQGARTRRGKRTGQSLQEMGKSGRLVSLYLPLKLGQPGACGGFTASQQRLLLAILRETTRTRKGKSKASGVITDGKVPGHKGHGAVSCPQLDKGARYIGFNGNGVRRGLGYYMTTPGGWLAKSGYQPDRDLPAFLCDLEALAGALALRVVGVRVSDGEFLSLAAMLSLATTEAGLRALRRVQLRLYAQEGYLAQWDQLFGWNSPVHANQAAADPQVNNSVSAVMAQIKSLKVRQHDLAVGIGVDASLLSKVLRGKKSWPQGWLVKVNAFLGSLSN